MFQKIFELNWITRFRDARFFNRYQLITDTAMCWLIMKQKFNCLQFNNPERPDTLQKVSIPTVTDDECRRAYGPADMFDSFICAGVPEGNRPE